MPAEERGKRSFVISLVGLVYHGLPDQLCNGKEWMLMDGEWYEESLAFDRVSIF